MPESSVVEVVEENHFRVFQQVNYWQNVLGLTVYVL